MPDPKTTRVTIVCPADRMPELAEALSLPIASAHWQDQAGRRFAAVSFLSDDPSVAPLRDLEKVTHFHEGDRLMADTDHVQVIHQPCGASAIGQLGLSPVLP